ncbi:leucyl aminopeptidase family protein [Brevundimonas aveniformis]|uniref:leucyl aminopeptidase family protein n=1 Tax=Brevundimonas aveniformis TaxID=370977 RepID=UPI00042A58A7|nr:leucyl aminopeptidase family protein [Brevundimonas aveniformis]
MPDVLIERSEAATPLHLISEAGFEGVVDTGLKALGEGQGFKGQAGQILFQTGDDGDVRGVWAGTGKGSADPLISRSLAARLPKGDYQLKEPPEGLDTLMFAHGWAEGGYLFDRYKTRPERGRARLVVGKGKAVDEIRAIAAASLLAREMVDTPAGDMGPLQIETIAREIAEAHGASVTVTLGDALLEENYPAIHAVGRAATPERAPRLIEIGWNLDQTDLPLVALVGKGVVFDSGGLDIKGAAGMRHMKKDMGGSAHALALGRLVMQAGLKVRLVVLVAAVENAISGDAFRPGDILRSRKGLTIEIGNTDAEGRVILSDALARAGEHLPDLTVDFATLTGAARVALGPELPPYYTDDEALADEIRAAAADRHDPVWRMPLWPGYREAVSAEIADVRNDAAEWSLAGSVTAALFLQRFAPETGSWVHLDIFAWNNRARPGWPMGGAAQGLRTLFKVLSDRYGR